MLVASLMFATMNALIKLAAPDHSLGEIVFFRGVPSLIGLGLWIAWHRQTLINEQATLHVRRNGAGMLAMWLGFYATSHLPLATAVTLVYTSPLFIAAYLLISAGGQSRLGEWASIALGFCGVLMVLKPTLSGDQLIYAAVGLCSGSFSAVAYLQVKALGRQGEPEWRTVMFFSIAASLTGLVGLMIEKDFSWVNRLLHDPHAALLMTGIGLTGAGGQLAMTRAFGKGSTWLSAALQYSTILFSAGWGFVIWDTIPGGWALPGIALIITCGVLSSITAARLKKPIDQSEVSE